MPEQHHTQIVKNIANNSLTVTRTFTASVDKLWRAWTEPALLDQWWAPRPWKTETSSLDFRAGGSWLYSMRGPDGERHYAKADYMSIQRGRSFQIEEYFCDDTGVKNPEMPTMFWTVTFEAAGAGSRVTVAIKGATENDLQRIIEMGFETGFGMAFNNLDELLSV